MLPMTLSGCTTAGNPNLRTYLNGRSLTPTALAIYLDILQLRVYQNSGALTIKFGIIVYTLAGLLLASHSPNLVEAGSH